MYKKPFALFVLLFSSFLCAAAPGESDIRESLTQMRENFFYSYTDSLIQHSLSADSFIGKLSPALPPHFRASLSFAGSFIDTNIFKEAGKNIIEALTSGEEQAQKPFTLHIPKALPLPTYAFSARLGGFLLPYDMGFYGSYFPLKDKKNGDIQFTYDIWHVGGDIRFALFEGNETAPKVSLGFGYLYSHFHFGIKGKKHYECKINSSPNTADSSFNMNCKTSTHTIFTQLQISKRFNAFTPYIGARAVLHISERSYDYAYNRTCKNPPTKTSGSGHGTVKTDPQKMSNEIQAHIYAGFAIISRNFETTFGANYNPMHNLFSVHVSFAYKQ